MFSLFKQIQLSQIFDILFIITRSNLTNLLIIIDFCVQARFNKILFYKLCNVFSFRFQCHIIQEFRLFEKEIENSRAAFFNVNFKKFLVDFESADVRHLTSFHALTTVFELFIL